MKLKSLICLFLVLLLSAPISLAQSLTIEDDGSYKGWTFEKNSDGSYSLTSIPGSYNPSDGCLVIPDRIELKDGSYIVVSGVFSNDTTGVVGSIKDGVFSSNPNIKVVQVNANIKSIGSSAFAYCSNLTEVVFMGSNVTVIGDYAFAGCTNLVSISIPEGVTALGQGAFQNCRSLKSVKLPSSLRGIGSSAFQWCVALASVNLPDGLVSIGSYAFEQCTSLKSVTIPGSVNVIGQNAFQYCKSLTSVTIEDSDANQDRVIEQWAFCQTGVSSIYIPGSISVVENNAFDNCQSLTDIVIGDGVDEIQSGAFGSCGKLANIKFESKSNPPSIANGAFTDWRISNGNVTVVTPPDANYEIDLKDGSLNVVKKENPDPENPDPENPDPENPDPENPTSVVTPQIGVDKPVAFYSLNGVRLSSPARGAIVIASYADGKSRKLILR